MLTEAMMIDLRRAQQGLTFRGAANVAPLADQQRGPTCGLEAVENVIQLFYQVSNDLVERDLIPRAQRHGALRPALGGVSLDPAAYAPILAEWNIPTGWYAFDPAAVVVPALLAHHAILVVGDAHWLGYTPTPPLGSWHAFVVTNLYTDSSGYQVLGFVGLDSNVPGRESAWAVAQLAQATASVPLPLLVTLAPVRWPEQAQSYHIGTDGRLYPQP